MIHTSMKKANTINDSSGIKLPPDNRIHLFDPVGLINENYGGYNIIKQRRPTKSYDDAFSLSTATTTTNGRRGLAAFDISMTDDDDESNNSSVIFSQSQYPSHKTTPTNTPPKPPVTTTMSTSPPRAPPQPNNHVQNLSPKSRTQAIAKGRKEMMDMIKDMPESFYELSLKDMVVVEHNKPPTTDEQLHHDHKSKVVKETRFANDDQETAAEMAAKANNNNKKKKNNNNKKKMKKSESRVKMVRSVSLDHSSGFLLKTSVFPISLGLSKKNKKRSNNLSASASFNVAPAVMKDTGDHNKDWWRKKSCISKDGDKNKNNNSIGGDGSSSGRSSRSNSGNSRHKHNKRFLPPCFSIFNGKKIKPRK